MNEPGVKTIDMVVMPLGIRARVWLGKGILYGYEFKREQHTPKVRFSMCNDAVVIDEPGKAAFGVSACEDDGWVAMLMVNMFSKELNGKLLTAIAAAEMQDGVIKTEVKEDKGGSANIVDANSVVLSHGIYKMLVTEQKGEAICQTEK